MVSIARQSLSCILAFNPSNQLAVRRFGPKVGLPFTGASLPAATVLLESAFGGHTPPSEYFMADLDEGPASIFFVQIKGSPAVSQIEFWSIERLESQPEALLPSLAGILPLLEAHLIDIPYLHLGENDFIYKFRPERERNAAVYEQDGAADALYQSRLCTAIKALARRHERTAAAPVTLDFGSVRYVVPSHFGFCLGVKNAIERAYEALAENPGRRVFMLSELIHNAFVNEDLIRRGLRYLQTDKGVPFLADGTVAGGAAEGRTLWDTLTSEDVVIIPAFGATNEDKGRLIRKGIPIFQYDATCMLVERVWKAARAYGREGYTVIIHGKYEHEETKATFSNTRRHAPALIVRNLDEARQLGEILRSREPAIRDRFWTLFAGKHTPGFDLDRDLQRVAVVNQTTLLVNETREIIAYLREVFAAKYGPDDASAQPRVGGQGRSDTLCYATQVNQDALARALDEPLDAAFVIGGKNSSNTYQLYRLCEERLGDRAFFIQSEANILSPTEVEHFVFHAKGQHGPTGLTLRRLPLQDDSWPKRILVTGGASCPDGIIQQVIARINGFIPADGLRTCAAVLRDLTPQTPA